MCGISGVATSVGPPPIDSVRASLSVLHHRGPEAHAVRLLEGDGVACALGHTRLRIIDVSEEADQPLPNEDGTVWVSFNGELYNFPELRKELTRAGHAFRSATDTEVLVHLYEEVGGDATRLLTRLRGMFAFALFDSKRGRLLLARDRLGIKPLYRARYGPSGIAFASEPMALARSGLAGCGPDSESLIGYLLWGSVQGPRTIFGGVEEVPAGGLVEWDAQGERTSTWWRPRFTPDTDPRDAESSIRTALEDAVARHLVADREVGVFLSGGVDSGSIASLAARSGSVRALTVGFPETGGDEVAAAAARAETLGLRHETVPVAGSDIRARLPDIARAMVQPTDDGVNTWIVSRAARQAGLVVALSGVGGDELFGGYPSFRLLPRVEGLARLLQLIPVSIRRLTADLVARSYPGGRLSRLITAGPDPASIYTAFRGLFGEPDLKHMGVARWMSFGDADLLDRFTPDLESDQMSADTVAYLELTQYLRNQLLRDTDQMSMAHSLEVRVPLLDDSVVAAVLLAPAEVRNESGKRLLQRAAGIHVAGPKETFTLPFDAWMRGPLREPVKEALLSGGLPLNWLVTPRARRELWEAFEHRRVHWSRPWSVAVLRLWADVHGLRW